MVTKAVFTVHGNDSEEKSGVAFSLFILHLDERFGWEISMHRVTQKCVKFNVVSTPGG